MSIPYIPTTLLITSIKELFRWMDGWIWWEICWDEINAVQSSTLIIHQRKSFLFVYVMYFCNRKQSLFWLGLMARNLNFKMLVTWTWLWLFKSTTVCLAVEITNKLFFILFLDFKAWIYNRNNPQTGKCKKKTPPVFKRKKSTYHHKMAAEMKGKGQVL